MDAGLLFRKGDFSLQVSQVRQHLIELRGSVILPPLPLRETSKGVRQPSRTFLGGHQSSSRNRQPVSLVGFSLPTISQI